MSMDLIDREKLVQEIKSQSNRLCLGYISASDIDVDDIVQLIVNAPTVNAESVRHGKWIEEKIRFEDDWGNYTYTMYICSECRNKEKRNENYCPNCGAKMDGE